MLLTINLKAMKKTTVHERIKLLRETLKLSPAKFAALNNMQQSSISRLESGKNEPRLVSLVAMAGRCNASSGWLVHGTGEMFNDGTIEENISKVQLAILEKSAKRTESSSIEWKEEAYSVLKEENLTLRQQLQNAMQVLINVTGGPGANSAQVGKLMDNLKSLLYPNPSEVLKAVA